MMFGIDCLFILIVLIVLLSLVLLLFEYLRLTCVVLVVCVSLVIGLFGVDFWVVGLIVVLFGGLQFGVFVGGMCLLFAI